MISCNLKGGIGNQLFQISTTFSLAQSNNDQSVFNLDACYTPMQGNKASKYKDTIFKNLNISTSIVRESLYTEPIFSYTPIQYSKNLCIDGYFQSEKYFSQYYDELLTFYNLNYKVDEIKEFLSKLPRPITSIHVRRGDYIPFQNIVVLLDFEYYKRSMDVLKSNTYLIFSHDFEWAKEKFTSKNHVLFEFDDELMNLIAMSCCDNHIIANSTFSWWGAYLNKSKTKTIVAPTQWFNPDANIPECDLIPPTWNRV